MGGSAVMFPPPFWGEYCARKVEIEQALDPRCHTIDWLDVLIVNGDARVFASPQAVIIVTVKQYPAGATELHGMVAAGALDDILPLIEQAEGWARSAGITFACISSRPGWVRVLKNCGYSIYQTELRKDL